MKRIVFIGCVHSSERFLKSTLQVEGASVVGIVTKTKSSYNSDFVSLEKYGIENNIDNFFYKKSEEGLFIKWLEEKKPDLIYCFGWSHLLSDQVLKIPSVGAVGYHPAALPKNRGRHPIIWSLVLGLKETASSFFFMDVEADKGDLISQEFVNISDSDDSSSLYEKLMVVGESQVEKFTKAFIENNYESIEQDHSLSNEWRKRSKKDGEIDFRMSMNNIYNLVRALARPYPGAHFVANGREVVTHKCKKVEDAQNNIEPGKILYISETEIEIKCFDGAVRFSELSCALDLKVGEYL